MSMELKYNVALDESSCSRKSVSDILICFPASTV